MLMSYPKALNANEIQKSNLIHDFDKHLEDLVFDDIPLKQR